MARDVTRPGPIRVGARLAAIRRATALVLVMERMDPDTIARATVRGLIDEARAVSDELRATSIATDDPERR